MYAYSGETEMYDQWIGKSLTKVLQEIDGDALVFLGSQSSFFDIATAGEMRREGYIDTLSRKRMKRASV